MRIERNKEISGPVRAMVAVAQGYRGWCYGIAMVVALGAGASASVPSGGLQEPGTPALPVTFSHDQVYEVDGLELEGGSFEIAFEKAFLVNGETPLGSTAATNQDLEQAIREGWFRSDLYYRLNVLPVRVPPVRERGDDIRLLLYHFIEFYNNELDLQIEDVSPESLQAICSHSWPGNVRELKNAVERAMLLAEDRILTPKDFLGFPSGTSPHHYFELPREGVDLEEVEADLVIQALEQTQGNQTRAGQLLGLTRHQIHYRMEKLGLSSTDREWTRKSSTGRIS